MSKSILKRIIFIVGLFCLFAVNIFPQNMFRKVTDFDGDGKSDYVVIRNENNQMMWYIWQSSQGFKAFRWGFWTDTTANGDYDGDGKTDIAVARTTIDPPMGADNLYLTYYIFQSLSNTFVTKNFTTRRFPDTNYSTVHQDYDGDGKTDIALLQASLGNNPIIQIVNSSNAISNTVILPTNHTSIRLGDMSGDGRSESTSGSIFSSSSIFITITNLVNNNSQIVQFGASGDRFVPADFDGDGIGDIVVWRQSEGNWYWLRSSDSTFRGVHWGSSGDIPVPADYDGDGKTDLAIWRAGTYWIYNSNSGTITAFQWGLATDKPVNY
jgi:spore coat protein A, manganese oxidase